MSSNHSAPVAQLLARTTLAAALVMLAACSSRELSDGTIGTSPAVVTADIQAGIERHIADRTAEHGGMFPLEHDGETLELRLVRVHTEYLANLGPGRHFACVDLADERGDVYDVDFFLEGEPGSMRVTETTVHKRNGRPYYFWEQRPDSTWHRVGADEADTALLGVVEVRDAFDLRYRATVPELDGPARAWIPIGESDPWQEVEILSTSVPGEHRMLRDQFDNAILMLELESADTGDVIEIRYRVERREKSAYEAVESERSIAAALAPEQLVPRDPEIMRTAAEVTRGHDTDLERARALYDHVLDTMRYAKIGDYGRGDATFACHAGHGNCTDYHSYFIALARAAGIPARFAIGLPVPSNRDDGGISGYHCWAEFLAGGRWWPVDISEADKYAALATYYFGRHPANRLELSRGRDLVVEPGPASGPINFLAYPLFERADGETLTVKPMLSFERRERRTERTARAGTD